jgi:hypothetical protein
MAQHSTKNYLVAEFSDGQKLFQIERPSEINDSHEGNYYNVVLNVGGNERKIVDATMHVPKPQRTIDGKGWILDIFVLVDGTTWLKSGKSILDIQVGDRLTAEQVELVSNQLK